MRKLDNERKRMASAKKTSPAESPTVLFSKKIQIKRRTSSAAIKFDDSQYDPSSGSSNGMARQSSFDPRSPKEVMYAIEK